MHWIGVSLPKQGTWVWSLVWEDCTCHWAAKSMCHSYWTCMPPCREPAWGIPPVTRSCGKSSDGKANQTSGFPPGISWASTPQKTRICLLFHFSNILWKKSTQGFSLLHLKGMFQLTASDCSLACLTGSPDLLQLVNCLLPPNRERHKAWKHLKDTEPFLKS